MTNVEYHPDAFHEDGSFRTDCEIRLDLIRENIDGKVPSILDVGCSGGYYSFKLRDKAVKIEAIDMVEDLIVRCQQTAKREGVGNITFQTSTLADYLLISPPHHAICLYMSVHHHVIQAHGWEMANYLLKMLSVKSPTLYFDMGQFNENCPSTGWWKYMPFTNDCEAWVKGYLEKETLYTDIKCIGKSTVHGVDRFFFKCTR